MTSSRIDAPLAVYLLPLTDTGAPDVPGEYIYLPPPTNPPYSIRFAIEGTSSICRQGTLHVNIPKTGERFDRKYYHQYPLHADFNKTLTFDVPIHCAGAFAYYTTYTPLPDFSLASLKDAPAVEPTTSATYYIDVSPKLTLQNELIPLDSLSVFSVVSKFMGQYPDDWDRHLQGIGKLEWPNALTYFRWSKDGDTDSALCIGRRNYNMVHFTPLAPRGSSNSPYSLYDQLAFDPASFPNGEKDVAQMIDRMEKECGLLGMTDVVWNHTANNSKWLEEYPEVGYNLETAPHLEPALQLDSALLQYGQDLGSLGLPTSISTVDELQRCIDGIKPHVLVSGFRESASSSGSISRTKSYTL